MLQQLLDPDTGMPRSPAVWAGLLALVGALVVAFWSVCSSQVERAEARQAEAQMAQMALADCLQYIPGSTIGSCTMRIAPPGTATPAPDGLAHASFTLR